jgi:ABC-2 type transport system permease protein
MEMAIFSHALREYLRIRRLFPWVVLALLCYVLAHFWSRLVPGSAPVDCYAAVSSLLGFRILALSSAILTTAILSQEVEGRTIVYLLTRPVPRWKLILIRYAASVLVVSLLGAIAVFATSWGAFNGHGVNAYLVPDLEAVVAGAMAYGALFLFVSLLVNRAMVYCLLFAFGWETSIPTLPGDLYRVSIFSYMQGIAQLPHTKASGVVSMLMGTSEDHTIAPTTACLTLGILVLGTLALSGWWFSHFEYVPREDAE